MATCTAITVGSFDGVHLGHAALLQRARKAVGPTNAGGAVIALSFYPHPLTTLRPHLAPPRLTTWPQRSIALRQIGADEALQLTPTSELLNLDPRAFVQRMCEEHTPSAWIEGPDFRFGRKRQGDVEMLEMLGHEFGFETIIVPQVEVALNDLTLVDASSTIVRWLLSTGRIADARCVLGRPYEMIGVVEPGDQRGAELGCATANVSVETMPPADGVYAARATLPDGRVFDTAFSVGSKPTFGLRPRTVEAHLIGWDGNLNNAPAGYGWTISITLHAWLREQICYDTLDALMTQIRRDIDRTIQTLEIHASRPNAAIIGTSP